MNSSGSLRNSYTLLIFSSIVDVSTSKSRCAKNLECVGDTLKDKESDVCNFIFIDKKGTAGLQLTPL